MYAVCRKQSDEGKRKTINRFRWLGGYLSSLVVCGNYVLHSILFTEVGFDQLLGGRLTVGTARSPSKNGWMSRSKILVIFARPSAQERSVSERCDLGAGGRPEWREQAERECQRDLPGERQSCSVWVSKTIQVCPHLLLPSYFPDPTRVGRFPIG